MRTIKFRGIPEYNQEFVYGSLRTYIISDGKEDCSIYFDGSTVYVGPNTVGQYTGKKDKNKNEIYEGDILKYIDEYDYYLVAWDDKNTEFIAENNDKNDYVLPISWKECEVIGNIHQTPELWQPTMILKALDNIKKFDYPIIINKDTFETKPFNELMKEDIEIIDRYINREINEYKQE